MLMYLFRRVGPNPRGPHSCPCAEGTKIIFVNITFNNPKYKNEIVYMVYNVKQEEKGQNCSTAVCLCK